MRATEHSLRIRRLADPPRNPVVVQPADDGERLRPPPPDYTEREIDRLSFVITGPQASLGD
jgi:hypothetical protein